LTTTANGPAPVSATSGSGPGTWTPAVAGQIYTGSAWAEAATSGRTLQTVLGFLSATGQVLDTAWAQGTSETTTGWTQTVPAVGVAPAGTAYVELVVLVYGTAQGEIHYLDSASLATTMSGSI